VPTAQTSVLSPLILSVPILSVTRPLAAFHLRRLLSEHPATIHSSFHSSSSSSSSSSDPPSFAGRSCFGTGGPHAILKILLFTRSSRRKCVRPSYSREINRTAPSSHPMARIVDAGFGFIHHIEPPCEGIVLYAREKVGERGRCTDIASTHTFIHALSMFHSARSLPPPALNNRRSESEGVWSGGASGLRRVNAKESTLEE
jgi:hypothetical protein